MKEGCEIGAVFNSKVRVYVTWYKQSKSLQVAAANTIGRGASLIACVTAALAGIVMVLTTQWLMVTSKVKMRSATRVG